MTVAPNCVCPKHWAVRGLPDPGTPLLKGDPERTRVRLRSETGSERTRHGSAARSRGTPAAGRALGEGSSSPGPARGARGKGQGQRLSAPREAGATIRATCLPRTEEGSESPTGLLLGKGSPPSRAAPRPPQGPQTHPLRGTGGQRRPPAARPRPAAEARRPPAARPRRPWLRERGVPVDQSARRRPARVMLRGGRLGGAGDRASSSSTPAAHGPSPGRRGLLNQPREGHAASTATNPAARPRPWATAARAPLRDLRARSPTLRSGPLGSGPQALWAAICGRPDKRTRGQKDARTGGQAPGLAGGGRAAGARAARPRKQRGPSAGPVRAAEKGGTDPDSEGTRRPGEAREGWREASQREAPPRSPPSSGPRAGGPGLALAQGAPQIPAQPERHVSELGGRGSPDSQPS